MSKIQRALISVSDKAGLAEFVRELHQLGIEIISTGGTARVIKEAGVPVIEISEFTGFPEILDGHVKMLHPKVHAGLLFVRGNAEHEAIVAEQGIPPIDLVVVNLVPLEQILAQPNMSLSDAIAKIDIDRSSLLRSAAKNHASVTVVVDPADYAPVMAELKVNGGTTLPATRARLAMKAFVTASQYDTAIAAFLSAQAAKVTGETPASPLSADGATGSGAGLPAMLNVSLPKTHDLQHGENPHQKAALYGDFDRHFQQLHGKKPEYNDILNLTAATELVAEFTDPTVAIIKHTNPCGVGSAATLVAAWNRAYATDREAPFGGVIAVNRPIDAGIASMIAEIFSEIIVAPGFSPDALAILQKKENLRLIRQLTPPVAGLALRSVTGGVLAQECDSRSESPAEFKTVTKRSPTQAERNAMVFAWRVAKHVKSNAIVFATAELTTARTLGIGAGQMSRVDSSKIAVWKAGEAGLSLAGSVVASDAFFPFPDGVIAAANAGATAVIQPGGSVRDAEIIAAADDRNLAMLFTGIRHFRH